MDITGIGAIFDFGGKIIDKIFPDKDAADKAKLEMLRLQQEGQFKEVEKAFDLAKAQIAVNQEEAKSGSLFVAGWRPAVGWTCVVGLAYTFLGHPLLEVILVNAGKQGPPDIDTVVLMELLLGMLGIGGLRTFEKYKGVASK